MNPSQPTKRLGELLIAQHLITESQLDHALAHQRSTREFLGAILLKMGFITPDALLVTLSEQFGLPRESVSPDRVDWKVVKQFPASALADGKCFPIRANAESVTVAIANPLDAWALSAIEQAAGVRKVKAVLILDTELQRILQEYRRQSYQAIEEQFKDHDRP